MNATLIGQTNPPVLTAENYFSTESQLYYMGTSQFKAFQRCEASGLAEVQNIFEREKSPSMLLGSFVDAHFEGTLDLFKAKNPELFKKDGNLLAKYENAGYLINRIELDCLFSMFMSGKKQVIETGRIAGVPFKTKIDSLLDGAQCRAIVSEFPDTEDFFGVCDGAIVDLKIMRDFKPIWSDDAGCKIPFVEFWGYDIQAAVYQTVHGWKIPFFIAAATSEKEPNLSIMSVPQNAIDAKLQEVESLAPRYLDIKNGLLAPRRCEQSDCNYCKRTKRLTEIQDYREVGLYESNFD